jgi:hypothetical protein
VFSGIPSERNSELYFFLSVPPRDLRLLGDLVPIPVGSIASLIGQANPIALAGLSKKP